MSTISVDNFQDKSAAKSIDSVYVTDGTAKAWSNMDGSGTLTDTKSLNVSSLTDDAVGLYTANLTNAMEDTDSVVLHTGPPGNVAATAGVNSAGSYQLTSRISNTGASLDVNRSQSALLGDLA